MLRQLRFTLLPFALCLFPLPALRAEPVRFARTPDVSPDGRLVAFSYLGDIWTADAAGGAARPVTMHAAPATTPVGSPDGRHIAFGSTRHGQYDVFAVPVAGGKPRRPPGPRTRRTARAGSS